MDIGIISSRYAKALLKYASQTDEKEKIYQDIQILWKSFQEIPTLKDYLLNPVLSANQKIDLLKKVLNKSQGMVIPKFLELIAKNNRLDLLPYIIHSFVELYQKQEKIIQSHLVVSTALDDEIIERLKKFVQKQTLCEVEFTIEQDESIIGGFILEYDTYRYDASVRRKLQNIKKALENNFN